MFSDDTFLWFQGLHDDNSRAYFVAHRTDYDTHVVGPLLALLRELAKEFGGEPHMFRPQRDTRFTPDKSPYKTTASGVLSGRPDPGEYYVQVSASGFVAATGYYSMPPVQLDRYRTALTDDTHAQEAGTGLRAVLEDLTAAGYDVRGEQLKTLPRGVARDTPNADLLRYKTLAVAVQLSQAEAMADQEVLERTTGLWRAARPLLTWLNHHAGTP